MIQKAITSSLAQFDQLPDSAHLRPKVCAQILGISIASYWRLISSGKLKAYRLTTRTTSTRVGDLRSFIVSRGVV